MITRKEILVHKKPSVKDISSGVDYTNTGRPGNYLLKKVYNVLVQVYNVSSKKDSIFLENWFYLMFTGRKTCGKNKNLKPHIPYKLF